MPCTQSQEVVNPNEALIETAMEDGSAAGGIIAGMILGARGVGMGENPSRSNNKLIGHRETKHVRKNLP
ncbi:MAG: hypothetical protein KJ630_17980 [Proteobacteria bacterium]|nr:hypothetical protein [Pseudomonadota bacterium]